MSLLPVPVPLRRSSRRPRRSSSASGASSLCGPRRARSPGAAGRAVSRSSRPRSSARHPAERHARGSRRLDRLILGEPWEVELPLALDAQRLAAGDEEPERWRRSGEVRDDARGIGQKVLDVVEDDVGPAALNADAIASVVGSGAARTWATAATIRSASRIGASGTKTVPPSASSDSSRASSMAKRVLPVPPGRGTVNTRGSSSSATETAS